jgi:hypothetical protein
VKIIFNFASRSRPEKFFAALDNIRSLAEGEYEVIAKLDSDDKTVTNSEVSEKLKQHPEVKVCWGISENKVHAINKGLEGIAFDIMIVMSDDVLFTEKGFDRRIIQDMQKYFPTTDGCLWYNDGTPNGHRIMTVSIIGRKYFDRTGKVYNEEYFSLYCDDEETRKAKLLGRIQYFPDVIFRHKHWLWDFSRKDELNARNDAPMMYEHDRQVFESREKINFGLSEKEVASL